METIAVWFSKGAPSAVAIQETFFKYGLTHKIRVLNNEVIEEDADGYRFLREVSEWLSVEIEDVFNPKYPSRSAVDVWEQRGAMVFPKGAPCTVHLKKEARQFWEAVNHPDWHVFGFTSEERARHDRYILTERSNVLPVLIDAGISRQDCFDRLSDAGIALPALYLRGYPNANCIGCVKATSPTYWNHVRQDRPDVFAARAEQSRRLGARLVRVKNRRIFLDELSPDAKGRPMKSLKMADCSILCEERAQ